MTVITSGVTGTRLGVLGGFFGGRVEDVVWFAITTRLSIPAVLVALAVVGLLGSGLVLVVATLLGISLESRGELLFAVTRGADGKISPTSPNLPLPGFDVSLALSVRWRPGRVFALEGQAGPHLYLRSGLSSSGGSAQRYFFGPTLGVVATLSPSRVFGVQAWLRVTPVAAGFQFGTRGALSGTLEAQVSLGALHLGALQLGIAATLEGVFSTASFEVSKLSGTTDLLPPNPGAGRLRRDQGAVGAGAAAQAASGTRGSVPAGHGTCTTTRPCTPSTASSCFWRITKYW